MEEEHSAHVHYDAFISYRHGGLDQFAAEGLHRRLESYRLPSSILKDSKTRGIRRVFRDQDELPLSSNLSDPIEEALRNSDWLIVVCTGRLPESQWCAREIQLFRELHGVDHILPVLVEGETGTSIPPAAVSDPESPAVADIRAETKEAVGKKMDAAVIRLASRMFGVEYGSLEEAHRERRFRRIAAVGAVSALFLFLFGAYCTLNLLKISARNRTISSQQQELQEEYREARVRFARSMVQVSEELLQKGQRKDALFALRSAVRDFGSGEEGSVSESVLPSVRYALTTALAEYQTDVYVAEETLPLTSEEWDSLYLTTEWQWEDWWPDSLLDLSQYVPDHEITFAAPLSDGSILALGSRCTLIRYISESRQLENYGSLLYAFPPSFSLAGADFAEGSGKPFDGTLTLLPSETDFLDSFYYTENKILYIWKDSEAFSSAGKISGQEFGNVLPPILKPGDTAVSEDGRLEIRAGENSRLEIFEKAPETEEGASGSPLKTFYDLAADWRGIRVLGDTGCYALLGKGSEVSEAWILDPDMEIIAHIPRYYGYEAENNCFLQYCFPEQSDRYEKMPELNLIRLPFRSWEELLRETDSLLGDYQPSEYILNQYGILQ